MGQEHWEVTYPQGIMRYIEYFRLKNNQVEKYDTALAKYIKTHCRSSGFRICSLGCGTGEREIDLANRGFEVVGIECHEESVAIANQSVVTSKANVDLITCDILEFDEIDKILHNKKLFDAVIMIAVPLSIVDHARVVRHFAKYITTGGMFVTGLWGYTRDIPREGDYASYIEVATSPTKDDFAVRLNYYEYTGNIIKWDAVYLYRDLNGHVRMERDDDILEVTPEQDGTDPLDTDEELFEQLPTYRVTECHPKMLPPYVYEYLIGWRKK